MTCATHTLPADTHSYHDLDRVHDSVQAMSNGQHRLVTKLLPDDVLIKPKTCRSEDTGNTQSVGVYEVLYSSINGLYYCKALPHRG